jgi:hypothetical protein
MRGGKKEIGTARGKFKERLVVCLFSWLFV